MLVADWELQVWAGTVLVRDDQASLLYMLLVFVGGHLKPLIYREGRGAGVTFSDLPVLVSVSQLRQLP